MDKLPTLEQNYRDTIQLGITRYAETESLLSIARRIGISFGTLKAACRQYNIIIPKRKSYKECLLQKESNAAI